MERQEVDSAGEINKEVLIKLGSIELPGELKIPKDARGLILFAHGSGSSRLSPRNQLVARMLRKKGLGTLLFDLLTKNEEWLDARTGELRFDIPFLAHRLEFAARWVMEQEDLKNLRLGFFGASTGGGAALMAAARLKKDIGAIVSRGGRPDLADEVLPFVTAPVLLIVGGEDQPVIQLNEKAFARLGCEKELKIIPGASHLFEESGALEKVSEYAGDWFSGHLCRDSKTVELF